MFDGCDSPVHSCAFSHEPLHMAQLFSVKNKGRVMYGQDQQRRIYYHSLWGNYFGNAIEITQCGTPNPSKPATDNSVQDRTSS